MASGTQHRSCNTSCSPTPPPPRDCCEPWRRANPSAERLIFCSGSAAFYVLAIGRFPSGVEAPQHTVPRQEPSDEPLHRFNDALVAMDAMLTEAEGRFGTRTRLLNHPVLGPLTAQEWRRFHQVHGRRHLKQIVVRANPRP